MTFQSVMDELRDEYLASFPTKISILKRAMSDQAYDSVELEFHKMKGTGATYGVPEISALGEVVELLCQERPQDLDKHLPDSLKILEEIVKTRQSGQIYDLATCSLFSNLQSMVAHEL